MLVSFPLSDVRKELRQTVLMAIVGDGYGGRQFHGANWVSITSESKKEVSSAHARDVSRIPIFSLHVNCPLR